MTASIINRRLEVPFGQYVQPDSSYLDGIDLVIQTIFKAVVDVLQKALDFVASRERVFKVKTPHCSYKAVSIHPKEIISAKVSPHIIISIDGGGVRGIIPITILALLEKRYGIKFTKIRDVEFVGSSAGGIIALALTAPSKSNKKEPRFTAEGVVELFTTFAQKVFDNSYWHTVSSLFGLREAKYETPRPIIQSLVGETKLSECICNVAVTSFDLLTGNTEVFGNANPNDWSILKERKVSCIKAGGDIDIDFAATATSAAPTYFPSLGRYVDGGLGANNPALLATLRALSSEAKDKPIFIFSLGTGKTAHEPITQDKNISWGALSWVGPLIDYLLEGSQNLVDAEMKQLAKENPNRVGYTRLQVLLENDEEAELDNADPANLERLKELATKCLDDLEKTEDGQRLIAIFESAMQQK